MIVIAFVLLLLTKILVVSAIQPIALWPLNDLYLNPAEDISGNGHHGDISSLGDGDYLPSHKTTLKSFTNSFVRIPNTNGDLSLADFTIMLWINQNIASHHPILMWEGNEVGPGFHLMVYTDGIWYLRHTHVVSGNVLIPLPIGGHPLIPGVWDRLTLSYNNDTGHVYFALNGVGSEVNTYYSSHWTNMEGDLYLGKGHGLGTSDMFFKGQLACVGLFDTYINDEALIDPLAITNKCLGYACGTWAHEFSQSYNPVGGGEVTANLTSDSRLSCGIYCLEKCCRSFSFSAQHQQCILHRTIYPAQPVTADSEWEFFTMVI